ncbi:MAG: hypothetical protein LCH35_05005 [Bacteroidetes bacterium]|uniref:hypothetical protein n=1 Tax=Flavobacterium sp. TaxID=239 RepID=UPI002FDAF0D1|nr:hypothetical protein [Bacteroidota bacterium]
MSKLTYQLLFLLALKNFSYSQNINDSIILISANDKLISSLLINEDRSKLSLGIYINGFECKNKRKKEIAKASDKKNNQLLPTFTINFLSFEKPKILDSLENINFSLLKNFNPNIIIPNPTYILIEDKNGSFALWKTFLNPIE